MLAEGQTNRETAKEVGVVERTIERWRADIDFMAEVDRLTHMVGIATRAERLRIAMRVIRQRMRLKENFPPSKKDLLDWLKFAQSETDGVKLDLTSLLENAKQMADSGSTGSSPES
jgi:hypothetical protein